MRFLALQIGLVGMLLIMPPVGAETWQYVTLDKETGNQWYLDQDSLEGKPSRERRFMAKAVYRDTHYEGYPLPYSTFAMKTRCGNALWVEHTTHYFRDEDDGVIKPLVDIPDLVRIPLRRHHRVYSPLQNAACANRNAAR